MKNNKYVFESERLGFRLWEEKDREKFALLNADKDVMRFFPRTLTLEESNKFIDEINDHFEDKGYGFWVAEIKETEEFIGCIGFLEADFEAEFTPITEIGWRLIKEHWKQGYAIEGARACMNYAYNNLDLDEIYSFTAKINKPSETVMKRLGMDKVGEFRHPDIDNLCNISKHVLYKTNKDSYLNGR